MIIKIFRNINKKLNFMLESNRRYKIILRVGATSVNTKGNNNGESIFLLMIDADKRR